MPAIAFGTSCTTRDISAVRTIKRSSDHARAGTPASALTDVGAAAKAEAGEGAGAGADAGAPEKSEALAQAMGTNRASTAKTPMRYFFVIRHHPCILGFSCCQLSYTAHHPQSVHYKRRKRGWGYPPNKPECTATPLDLLILRKPGHWTLKECQTLR